MSSLNLAIPSIQRATGASAAQLVWINASYSLVFAGLLLPSGALGDRFGRKGALQLGLGIFIVSALIATLSEDPAQLIALRAVMGIGAALTMPATLSIITVIFPAHERAKAIAIWSGFAGAGGALGIVSAGLLLEYFWWGSVFLINVPIAVLAVALVTLFVPTSRDEAGHPLDPVGAVLSIVALSALVYGLIEGPEFGWTDPLVIAAFIVAVVGAVAWQQAELRQRAPMLDPRLFRIRPFSLGSLAITSAFLLMFGMFFVATQYLQFVLGYSALGAAVRLLPFAGTMVVIAPRGPALAARIGAGRIITLGMVVTAIGAALFGLVGTDTSYAVLVIPMVLMAGGMALNMPAATESIVTSLPQNKAGVASAMNDTTREVGGAVGIALLGSLLSSGYRAGLGEATDSLPGAAADAAEDSIGAALAASESLPDGVAAGLVDTARQAFVDGMRLSMWVGSAILLLAAAVIGRSFPRSADDEAVDGATRDR